MIDELLADAAVTRAVREIHHGDNDEATIARVVWTVLVEPGDGIAGTLTAELGAAEALRFALSASHREPFTFGAPRALEDARARWLPRANPTAVRTALRRAADAEARLVLPDDPEWPIAVDALGVHAPLALWVRGQPALLNEQHQVSLVGARAASSYGEHLSSEFAGDLAAGGAVVVSGAAYGIDGAAHRAALGVEGKTIAVLAGGVDRAYPQGHQQLLQRIAQQGVVMSELPCGAAPTKWRFLSRNRLIAAISAATVVVEAGWRSGSLNTAGHAAALGRPLGAVPGPVTSATSAGCHRLLREYDAQCVTTAAEIRELMGMVDQVGSEIGGDDSDSARLVAALHARTEQTVDALSRALSLPPESVSALLAVLQLDGLAQQGSRGWRRSTQ